MERSLTLAMRSAERAAGFIRSIKGQTRTHDQKEAGVTFDLAKGISDSLVLLATSSGAESVASTLMRPKKHS